MRILLLVILAMTASATAHASESERVQIQLLINDAGHRCDRVANLRPGAAVDNGDVMIIADCTDGSSHVIRLTTDDRLDYFMACTARLNPVKC